jgi:hypothetical protein
MKLIVGSLLAALLSFSWGYLSWEVLGWHKNNTFGFKDEADVKEALARNVKSGHGLYLLPHLAEIPSFLPAAEKAAKLEKLQTARDEGPFVYATIRPGKRPFNMGQALGLSFGRSVLGCLILAVLLANTAFPYLGKVVFCSAAGVFAGVAAEMPAWIWFELAGSALFVALADSFFEWTLAGLVLAGFVGKPQIQVR